MVAGESVTVVSRQKQGHQHLCHPGITEPVEQKKTAHIHSEGKLRVNPGKVCWLESNVQTLQRKWA